VKAIEPTIPMAGVVTAREDQMGHSIWRKRWGTTVLVVSLAYLGGCHSPSQAGAASVQRKPWSPKTGATLRPAGKAAQPQAPATSTVVAKGTSNEFTSEQTDIPMIGLDERQITAALGRPLAEDMQGLGKTWRYRNGSCTATFTLYPDVETRDYHTLAIEVTHDDRTAEGQRSCVGEFRAHLRVQQQAGAG
jgi:hypothetical protein